MKILFVDSAVSGHHLSYLNALAECADEAVAVLPDIVEGISCRMYQVDCSFNQTKKMKDYLAWIKNIRRIVAAESPDIVHFLYGDSIYHFFGIGLHQIKKCAKTIIIFHHIRRGRLRDISSKCIACNIDEVVVHTQSLIRTLEELHISNGLHIEYPQFNTGEIMDQRQAQEELEIHPGGSMVLLALGGTREDKGLDILLTALKKVKTPFYLLIAGQEQTFKRDYIESEIKTYKEHVSLFLKVLDDHEFAMCLNAADIVVLPYRKIFDGASGPLGEGAALGKMIIGPMHGSVGDIIRTNHLGYTFEAENADSLTKCIEDAISKNWKADQQYEKYREILSVKRFMREYRQLYLRLSEAKNENY